MGKLYTPTTVTAENFEVAINTNLAGIDAALSDSLSRTGVAPNQMEANLDLGGNRIINCGGTDCVGVAGGSPPVFVAVIDVTQAGS